MTLTAEQHEAIANSYDKAAADLFVPAERRAEFANKANWFRHLAGLEVKKEAVAQVPDPSLRHAVDPAQMGIRNFRMRHLLATLWLIGAVVYLITTLVFTNAVSTLGEDDQGVLNSEQGSSVPKLEPEQIVTSDPVITPSTEPLTGVGATAEQSQAISPNPLSSETAPLKDAPNPPPTASARTPSQPITIDTLKLKSTANIRSGPSLSANVIGTAAVQSELQIISHEADWVQFTDPRSGNTGWIHSSLVEPLETAEAAKEKPDVAVKPTASQPANRIGKNAVVAQRLKTNDRSLRTMWACPRMKNFFRPESAGGQAYLRGGECCGKA